MNPTLDKADPTLRGLLESSSPDDSLRVILVLAEPETTKAISPVRSSSPEELRRILRERQRTRMAQTFGPTLQSLRDLELNPQGGELTSAVVVEGPVSAIREALALPGVTSALHDAPIGLIEPTHREKKPRSGRR